MKAKKISEIKDIKELADAIGNRTQILFLVDGTWMPGTILYTEGVSCYVDFGTANMYRPLPSHLCTTTNIYGGSRSGKTDAAELYKSIHESKSDAPDIRKGRVGVWLSGIKNRERLAKYMEKRIIIHNVDCGNVVAIGDIEVLISLLPYENAAFTVDLPFHLTKHGDALVKSIYERNPNVGNEFNLHDQSGLCEYLESVGQIYLYIDALENNIRISAKKQADKVQFSYEIISFVPKRCDGGSGFDMGNIIKKSANGLFCNGFKLESMLRGQLSVEDGSFKIHSVKRLIDGEVFTIGDRVELATGIGVVEHIDLSTREGSIAGKYIHKDRTFGYSLRFIKHAPAPEVKKDYTITGFRSKGSGKLFFVGPDGMYNIGSLTYTEKAMLRRSEFSVQSGHLEVYTVRTRRAILTVNDFVKAINTDGSLLRNGYISNFHFRGEELYANVFSKKNSKDGADFLYCVNILRLANEIEAAEPRFGVGYASAFIDHPWKWLLVDAYGLKHEVPAPLPGGPVVPSAATIAPAPTYAAGTPPVPGKEANSVDILPQLEAIHDSISAVLIDARLAKLSATAPPPAGPVLRELKTVEDINNAKGCPIIVYKESNSKFSTGGVIDFALQNAAGVIIIYTGPYGPHWSIAAGNGFRYFTPEMPAGATSTETAQKSGTLSAGCGTAPAGKSDRSGPGF